MALHKLCKTTGSALLINRGKRMRYSLGAHVHETTPDILYGDVGQLWVDGSDDFLVWLFELWTSESSRERFGGDLVL